MFQQDLLPSNRVVRNEAQQWLSSEDCAHPALLHCEYNKNHVEVKVYQSSFQGGLAFTFLLALKY